MLRPFYTEGPEGWPFNELERLLQGATSDPELYPVFWDLLLQSTLFLLDITGTAPHDCDLPQAAPVCVHQVTLDSGPPAVAAFTSRDILRHSITGNARAMAVPARSLMETTGYARIALNPCGPYGKEITPEEMRLGMVGVIMKSDHELHLNSGARVLLGRLRSEPLELIEALQRIGKANAFIRAVYLGGVLVPGAGDREPHPLVGLDSYRFEDALHAIEEVVQSWSKRSKTTVDVVDIADRGSMARYLRRDGRRIYKKPGWLATLCGPI
jgi:hypothetical protein